jgi:hypothetical protein
MRSLTLEEQSRLECLTENSVVCSLIEPTATGLKKSIMDATGAVRSFLKQERIHDYSIQGQGPSHKVQINSFIYDTTNIYTSKASLYRPITKKGDPRIWFQKLNRYASPNDILAIIFFDKKLHVLNLTKAPINLLVNAVVSNPIQELINAIRSEENSIAAELLQLLKKLARSGPIPSLLDADTSVGRTLETALGININSSKEPDYKGIELKSYRLKRGSKGNRKNLFAQVPNWKLSKFKSSAEILNAFGYQREEDFKLYCTISTLKPNSQGLKLRLDRDMEWLYENSDRKDIGDFAVWTLKKLHERLLKKHKETFWIAANTVEIDGQNHFIYTQVEHTKSPILSQFDLLLEQGIITLDHLIKKNKKGRVVEKGPLFKIKPNCLGLLFPPSKQYNLIK